MSVFATVLPHYLQKQQLYMKSVHNTHEIQKRDWFLYDVVRRSMRVRSTGPIEPRKNIEKDKKILNWLLYYHLQKYDTAFTTQSSVLWDWHDQMSSLYVQVEVDTQTKTSPFEFSANSKLIKQTLPAATAAAHCLWHQQHFKAYLLLQPRQCTVQTPFCISPHAVII